MDDRAGTGAQAGIERPMFEAGMLWLLILERGMPSIPIACLLSGSLL